ncbi:hypothetical protein HPB52_007797 [Rhipicephalus sanguineus]|uniref:Mutator-like transposase domain-containing protein n=1 Tax=Rhipicephalus sanguineus TaxID=34632 RepID=A0A9D4PID0_RHISA|nr:hypothetical protein HPB52_007797 [Rhipicephalus sanguineus]
MSATERKFQMMPEPEGATTTTEGKKYFLVQGDALSDLLFKSPCPRCLATGVKFQEGTQLGLATKLQLVCEHCGVVSSSWSSARQNESKAFDVNIRAIVAMKQIGKGQTALNDFWATMNVSHRGLHHRTFQRHLKQFREPQEQTLEKFYAESASAVKKTYKEMNPSFCRDITVNYDGTWHKRGHTSHIGVGAVIEYHTGLILDAVVLSNQCLGCQLGLKPEDTGSASWLEQALGGKGRLTKALIDKLTDYYGWALRNNSSDVAAMQRAVMASFHHVTSTDTDPHHDLCPEGVESWCRHDGSKANGVPPPKHKYNLPGYVANALLPVYQRLSQASLLQRCLGAKTQNESESLHPVLWSLMPKEQHASLIAVETALHEAVLRYNAGCYRATQELSSSRLPLTLRVLTVGMPYTCNKEFGAWMEKCKLRELNVTTENMPDRSDCVDALVRGVLSGAELLKKFTLDMPPQCASTPHY